MVVYAGLPPAMLVWQDERDKKNKCSTIRTPHFIRLMFRRRDPGEKVRGARFQPQRPVFLSAIRALARSHPRASTQRPAR